MPNSSALPRLNMDSEIQISSRKRTHHLMENGTQNDPSSSSVHKDTDYCDSTAISMPLYDAETTIHEFVKSYEATEAANNLTNGGGESSTSHLGVNGLRTYSMNGEDSGNGSSAVMHPVRIYLIEFSYLVLKIQSIQILLKF